jgi:hypothetical protein
MKAEHAAGEMSGPHFDFSQAGSKPIPFGLELYRLLQSRAKRERRPFERYRRRRAVPIGERIELADDDRAKLCQAGLECAHG